MESLEPVKTRCPLLGGVGFGLRFGSRVALEQQRLGQGADDQLDVRVDRVERVDVLEGVVESVDAGLVLAAERGDGLVTVLKAITTWQRDGEQRRDSVRERSLFWGRVQRFPDAVRERGQCDGWGRQSIVSVLNERPLGHRKRFAGTRINRHNDFPGSEGVLLYARDNPTLSRVWN